MTPEYGQRDENGKEPEYVEHEQKAFEFWQKSSPKSIEGDSV